MIYHLSSHAAINTDVLTRDETSLVRAKKEYHIGYIQWIANTSSRLLNGIGTFIDGVGRVNPSRRYAVYTHLSCKTDCQGVSQSHNATFCCRITFRLWLTHTVTRGRYIDDGRSFGEMWSKELGEIERSRSSTCLSARSPTKWSPCCLSITQTVAPSFSNSSAIHLPMPCAPPVTITILFLKSIFVSIR